MSIIARFDGECPACGLTITEGWDEISMDDEYGWVHEACADDDGEY